MAQVPALVRRLLETPDIARAVPRLPAEVLHRVIERCGLDACADIVALTTPRQLERLLDMDLWRAPVPGADETLDAARFGEWLEVLLDLDPDVAVDRLAAMDLDLVVGGLANHIAVYDGGAVAAYIMLDGEEMPEKRPLRGGQISEIGGFVVKARRSPAWHTIVDLLFHLHDACPAFFFRLMRGVIALSDSGREADGFHQLLDRRDQHEADLADARGERRDRQGYVAPAQARAFLQAARTIDLHGTQPAMDPIVRASLRDITPEPLTDEAARGGDGVPSVDAVMEVLSDAGVVTRPRALIGAGETADARLALVRAFAESHLTSFEELAFLANALVSGGTIHGRAFTMQEASDAAAATCNLGLENWPGGWGERDLVTAFRVGWTVVHRELCRGGAAAAIEALADLSCDDRDVQWALQTLRRELIQHLEDGEPWRARQSLDAILMLDAPAWAVLRALIDECPAMHAALIPAGRPPLRVDPDAVTFVARNSDLAAVRAYLASLPATLTG